MFWVIWVISVMFSSLIFLNFIIAEVSNSYQKIKDTIASLIYKERAVLVLEAEDLIPKIAREAQKDVFPKYIIIRSEEEN